MLKTFVLVLAGALAASGATIYNLNNSVGAGSISGAIQTDGIIGVLGTSNILDWNLVLNDGSSTFNLLGPLSGNNSAVLVSGNGFSATASQLLFNFSDSVSFALFQNPNIGSSINYFCFEATAGCTGSPAGESLRLTTGGNQFTAFSGTQVVASVGGQAAPEPSTFGLLGVGIALVVAGRKKFARS